MIGDNIRKARKSKGLKIKEISEKSGYAYNHISKIEHNHLTPKITTVIDISDVLGVSIDELVGHEVKDG